MIDNLVLGIKNKDKKSISKAITLIENNCDSHLDLLSKLYPLNDHPHKIGITGPPGAGKSSVTNLLINHFRKLEYSVAVILVDPTSPFSNGAVLGDRIRMFNHHNDSDVFIRSMATRGSKGGLSNSINEIADIFDSAKYDIVLFETVGVGQVEIDVVEQVDTVILVLVPESGDDIQMMKAGIIEIADIFLINKSDRADADKLFVSLNNMLNLLIKDSSKVNWIPNIIKTIATEDNGIDELIKILIKHKKYVKSKNKISSSKSKQRYINKVHKILNNQLNTNFWNDKKNNMLDEQANKHTNQRISPFKLVEKLINDE